MGHGRGRIMTLGLAMLLGACHVFLPLGPGSPDSAAGDTNTVDVPTIQIDLGADADLDLTPPDLGPPISFEDWPWPHRPAPSSGASSPSRTRRRSAPAGPPTRPTPTTASRRRCALKPDPFSLLWQGAGIAVRVQDPSPPAEVNPGLYACVLSPDGESLSVARCEPQTTPCEKLDHVSGNVALKTPYVLHATVQGITLTCEVPGQLGPITWQVTASHAQGAVSLVTLAASADFDDLRIEPL